MRWVSAFSYLPINYAVQLAEVENQTQRILFDNNLNGSKIRLRFSNKYSTSALNLQRVTVGIEKDNHINSIQAITRNGSASISLDPGEEVWSDKVELTVQAGDRLAITRRLYKAYPGKVTVLNRGIGENRLLHDATKIDFLPAEGSCFGTAGIKRFEQDIFGEGQVDAVLVLIGINDIMHPIQFDHLDEQVTPEELQNGYQKLIEIAHRHGAKIFGATITPCGNEEYPADWLPRFEALRLPVNGWFRSGACYDGFFDYDAAAI